MSSLGRLRLVAHGVPARDALWEAIAAARGGDSLAPVTVAVPSVTAGLSVRRALARRVTASGFVNVRFLSLARIAELLGAPALATAGRSPLTPALHGEAVRVALAAAPGPLAAAAAHPGTRRLVDATFRDLRAAGAGARGVVARAGSGPATVVRAFDTTRDHLAAFYDEVDVAGAAAAAIEAGTPAARELGPVVVHLPRALAAHEQQLVEALARAGAVFVIIGLTGDASADASGRELAAELAPILGPATTEGAPVPPLGTQVVCATDPDDEVRAAVRVVLERAAAGTPLHRMAILFRNAEPYARVAHQVLANAQIPVAGPSSRRVADSVAGRVALGLLELADRDLARDAFVAWLAAGPVLDPAERRPVDAHRWDMLSRHAGIVGSAPEWDARLAHHERVLTNDHDAIVAAGDANGVARRLEAEIAATAALRRFVADLAAALEPPSPPTWRAYASWASELLARYLGGEGRRAAWPEAELEAARQVTDAIDRLGALAELGAAPDLATFRTALTIELDTPLGRLGRFGTGVFVGSLFHAYGADFDVVFVVGMAEGAFPPRGHEDPLLRDGPRRAAGLPVHAARRADERRDYLAALAAAPERVLSFPRADPRAQRKRLPSRWLVQSASAHHGAPLAAAALLALPNQPWLRVVPSFEAGVLHGGEPASFSERDVAALRSWSATHRSAAEHPLVVAEPALAAGFAAISGRASAHLTPFDGLVGPIAGLGLDAQNPVSPTALETWADCPFRYLLANVLRVRDVPRPEDVDTISPLDRGTLVHSVLEEFVRRAPARTSPEQRWTPEEHDLLTRIAADHCDRAEAAGLTGHPRRWTLERRRLVRELSTVLEQDERFRRELGVVPLAGGLEHAFGIDGGHPAVEISLPGGRTVAFRGRVDRIDASPDGARAVVWDYKTGSRLRVNADDPVDAGTLLQLPVYAHAAATATGASDVHAYYWMTRAGKRDGYQVDDGVDTRFEEVVALMLAGIDRGVFPADPGDVRFDAARRETWDNCCYCPYDRICPPDRDRAFGRKHDDPALDPYFDLVPAPDHADGEVRS